MAWLPDEQYVLMQDTRDKAITARSARRTRTHNGKGGAVKFPSDYLTAKEKRKLSGECKTYRMNDPMTWAEFMKMPDDLRKTYIKAIRAKYSAPDVAIADMMGVSHQTFRKFISRAGLGAGKVGRPRKWDEEGFMNWKNRVPIKTPVEDYESVYISKDERDQIIGLGTGIADAMKDVGEAAEKAKEGLEKLSVAVDNRGAVPNNGTLTFEGKSEDILRTMNDILRNRYVRLSVQWTVVDAPDVEFTLNLDTDALKKAATTIDYAILNDQRRRTMNSLG